MGPSAEVFFKDAVEAADFEAFLIKGGYWNSPRAPSKRSKPHKPKRRISWSYEIGVAPAKLGLVAPAEWLQTAVYGGKVSFNVSARSLKRGNEFEEWLLKNDWLPEDLAQVVSVGSNFNCVLSYDAVNAFSEMVLTSLGGCLRTRARK